MEQPRNFSRFITHKENLHQNEFYECNKLQGELLLYAKSTGLMILAALGTIAAAQISGTDKIEKTIHKLLNYCATHRDATLQ